MSKYLLVDYYVDEPACFGVPPFISPYIRYTYGAIKRASSDNQIDYITVDELRDKQFFIETGEYEMVFMIAGWTVPGRYLGGKIGSVADIISFIKTNSSYRGKTYLGGPIRNCPPHVLEQLQSSGISLLENNPEDEVYFLAGGDQSDNVYPSCTGYENINTFAPFGAEVVTKHFRFPHIIAEIETYRGCTRKKHCSFCSESLYKQPIFRATQQILDEIQALYDAGCVNFRLGRQADIYTYMADMDSMTEGFPKPNPSKLEELYTGIRNVAPKLEVLHLDNVNPGTLAIFPEESIEITKIIAAHNTPMDTAAMGMESADPAVIEKNSLKASPDQMLRAIEIIHEHGQSGSELPSISPGLNFVGGLPGETDKTYEMNYRFLQQVLEKGYNLRRINIRKVHTIENTPLVRILAKEKLRGGKSLENKFDYFKSKIRKEIDTVMLQRVFPKGTIIQNVVLEKRVPNGYLGRAVGSYPITCHIWTSEEFLNRQYALKDYLGPFHSVTAIVVGYKERAVYALALEDDVYSLGEYIWKKIVPANVARAIWENGIEKTANQLPAFLNPMMERLMTKPTF